MAGYVELNIDQGASFNITLTITEANGAARNLVSFTANSQMKKSYDSLTSVTIDTIVSDGANGIISLSMNSNDTANLDAGRYVYDVVTTDSVGFKQRIIEGSAIISPGVTR